ncbi:uncharacterized protein LOC118200172 isoform X2 [Stegodyphus dumicola]|uniref:uncharacterized protein LOC118200172 isoform X2 n=1 Tax=Stegodyphus dumicola TaxID=202533 RepID=UPI0015AD668E|nr:uncharacterized protein LOC118200172 isoform X2 [Stegodyphus dumicola]
MVMEVEKHHNVNCCNIVDEQTLSSIKQRKSILICFVDETETNTFLGMNILVAEENQLEIRNKILTLKCNPDISFQLCKDSIYVWCVKNVAWNLFYILYKHFLKSPAVTTFGAVFYYAIASQYLMWNEQNMLYLTGKNSDNVKNVYDIHEMQTNKFHTASEIMVREKNSKKGLKRKIEYEGKSYKISKHNSGDFLGCVKSVCSASCRNNKWNIFGELKHYFPNSYSDILLRRMHSNVSEVTSNLKNFSDVLEISPSIKKAEKDNCKVPIVSKSEISMNRRPHEYKLALKLPPKINVAKTSTSPSRSAHKFPLRSDNQKNETCIMENICFSKSMNSNIKSPERHNKMQSSFLGFQTAAGRNLNISEAALKAAKKMLAEVCSEKDELFIEDEDLKPCSSTTASFENSFQNNKGTKTVKITKQNSTEASVCDTSIKNDNFSHDENIDDAITKEIFEIPFDDDETKSDYTHSPFTASDANRNHAPHRRVRKSLGGRRSFKIYSKSDFSSPKQAK